MSKAVDKVLDVKVAVRNCPDKDLGTGYLVVRAVESVLWYYGFYDTIDRAVEVAVAIGNGLVLGVYKKESVNA